MSSPLPPPSAAGLLDDVNKAIVEQLQQDGRRTYGSIAEAVGLSEAAVRQRVQKMRDAGIMQIVAVTDPLQVGFRRQAMVGIRADGDTREVADRLAAVDDIDYVVMVTGTFDILVELVCEDEDHMLDLLNGVIRQIPGVRVYPTSFTPSESTSRGVRIEGVRFELVNRELFDSTRLGIELAAALLKLYPDKIDLSRTKRLMGSDDVIDRLTAGQDPRSIQETYRDQLAAFVKLREQYLLYR